MELFKLKRGGPMKDTDSLYVRSVSGTYDASTGAMERGAVVSLDTYFNAFSCSKYLRWTSVRTARAELDLQGRFKAELLRCRAGENEEVVFAAESDGPVVVPFDFTHGQSHCYYYLRLTALGEKCAFLGGVWCTDSAPAPVKVAVIICTYRREDYVLKNVAALRGELLDAPSSPVRDDLEIFVVDNGQSLEGRLPEHPRVRLFYNKNCGGSGGFTRGLIEALKRQDELTHVLLMDDDVVVDTNAVEKTIQFFKVLRPEYADLHIAGGMLYMDKPVVQHEATARWDGNIHPNNAGLDFSDPKALRENEIEKKADYAGWWYLAFSLALVRHDNLPLPLFIKADDVEYCIRNMHRVLVLNGVAVWHEGFIGKERPFLEYYIIRNYLVVSAMHSRQSRLSATLLVLFKRIMRGVIFDVPEASDFIVRAVQDYLTGPEFFTQINAEALNAELREITQGVINYSKFTTTQKALMLVKKIPTRAFWRAFAKFVCTAWIYLRKRKEAEKAYQEGCEKLKSIDYWEKAIGL